MAQSKGKRGQKLPARDAKGRILPGHSLNYKGRPRKEPEVPKLLDELIAEKLWQKQAVTGPDGKVRMVSAYDRIIDSLIESLATAKPREKMQILEWLEKRALFNLMREMVIDPSENPSADQQEKWRSEQNQQRMLDRLARFGGF